MFNTIDVSAASELKITVSRLPVADVAARSAHYPANRAPLQPQPLVKLPIGSIVPRGWLRTQLVRMADGFVGRLDEISRCCRNDSAWLNPEGNAGWEEVPYWLKGYVDLGYVLGDERITRTSRKWLDAIIDSQQEDGYFGPRENKKTFDAWPNMIILCPLRSYYEATGDERVPKLMARYFTYRAAQKDEELFPSQWGQGAYNLRWWQHVRASDELESIYWLYNRTGDASLLDFARRIYRLSANWNNNVASWHGVNICQGFRAPAIYFQQAGDRSLIEGALASLARVYGEFGQVPGGMFGADENCRKGYTDPRQAAETCSMAELMHSYQSLLKITGDADFADRCEDVAFNSLPASMTPDLKALHYLTSPNMTQLDRENKAPGLENSGCMLAFSPHRYRCCQHNVAMSWPYFAEHLVLATGEGGLAAAFYAPCEARAKVADGVEVRVVETTDYPFRDMVRFDLSLPKATRFPFALRIPGWCRDPRVAVNDRLHKVAAKPGHYLILDRTWSDGDRIELYLPMELELRRYPENHDSVAVVRGPLTYSLKIGEKWVKYDDPIRQPFCDRDAWPAWEVYAETPWNYGLALDERPLAEQFAVHMADGPLPEQPFDARHAPIRIAAKGRRIEAWRADRHNLVGMLQDSPARAAAGEAESIELIPMGCARLRISAFPTVSAAPDAIAWTPPPRIPHKASHEHDDIAALSDGREPKHSGDHDIPRFTWWPRRGTSEWVTYEFEKPTDVSEVNIYWFDDEGRGFCRVPKAWRLSYRADGKWKPVEPAVGDGAAAGAGGAASSDGAQAAPVAKDAFNRLTFKPVRTTELRLDVELRDGYSGGILEWIPGRVDPS